MRSMDQRANEQQLAPRELLRRIGARLELARVNAGLSLAGAADLARLTRAELQLIESGRRGPLFYEAARLADLYGVSLDRLASTHTAPSELL